MGLQLIFVVETDKKCKSDQIYIKDTIEQFYQYDSAHTKFSFVYMDGKGNLHSAGLDGHGCVFQRPHCGAKRPHVITDFPLLLS